jgi:hypothetical protein
MGYRDLECFNMALLVKQGWRLIQNPESLVARIFRENYYGGETFLNARLGKRPSYAWRSICNARSLLKDGLIWRVGDGKSINIWGDRWIPSPCTYEIQSPIGSFARDTKVCDLVDSSTKWWNISLVTSIFSEVEAAMILSLPICPQSQQDRVVWVGTRTGFFSVKSAYHMAKEKMDCFGGECSTGDPYSNIWKAIWSVKGPKVVNNFLWKACNGILPTRVNLYKRGISDDPMCPICHQVEESVGHILWHYPSSRDVWSVCNVNIQKCPSFDDDFIKIFEILHDRLDVDELQLMVVVARQIWLRRNSVVFGGVFSTPAEIVRTGQAQIDAFWEAESTKLHRPVSGEIQAVQRWTKPAQGVIKINWDASVATDRNTMGMGIMARDHEGKFLAGMCDSQRYILDPATAEALAAWKMVRFCLSMGWDSVWLEGDCLEVVQAMNSSEAAWGRYGPLINESKQLLEQFQNWTVGRVPRTCNVVAHKLAQFALTCSEEMIWHGEPPSCISGDITAEAGLTS